MKCITKEEMDLQFKIWDEMEDAVTKLYAYMDESTNELRHFFRPINRPYLTRLPEFDKEIL